MKIPADAVIPRQKLTHYLLVLLPEDDKSQYLARGGFTQENPDDLEQAIRTVVADNEAEEGATDRFGTRYTVSGRLRGVNGVDLGVVTVWIIRIDEETFRFVTLVPEGRL